MADETTGVLSTLLTRLLDLLQGAYAVTSKYASNLGTPFSIPQNPVVVTSVAVPDSQGGTYVQVLPLNKRRKQWILQNRGITILRVKLGNPPSSTAGDNTLDLPACTVTGDGTGGLIIDDLWKGAVYVQSASATGSCLITELI